VQKHISEFQNYHADIRVISFTPIEQLKTYQKNISGQFYLYSDTDRKFYHAMGLKRAGFFHIFHPKTIFQYTKYAIQGKKIQSTQEDVYQLGGDFIVNSAGELVYVFRGERPDDRPTPKEMLKVLASLD